MTETRRGKNGISNNLRREREARRLSLEQLARKAGIRRGSLWQMENGEIGPSLETALRLSRALRVPVEHLFWLEGEDEEAETRTARPEPDVMVRAVLGALAESLQDELFVRQTLFRLRRSLLVEAQRVLEEEERQAREAYAKSFI